MFTLITTVNDFVYFLAKIKKHIFKSQHGYSVPLGFVCNTQMSYLSVVRGRIYFYSLT